MVLPPIDEYKPTADGRPPLARGGDEFLIVELPDGRNGIRETNTMPQWAGSCWYYLRYIDAHNTEKPWDLDLENYWMPVDLYVGGIEHAVLHLLYARFWHKVLFDAGLVSTKEPFQKLFNQGLILSSSYPRPGRQVLLLQPGHQRRRRQVLPRRRPAPARHPGREDGQVEEQRHRPARGDRRIRR